MLDDEEGGYRFPWDKPFNYEDAREIWDKLNNFFKNTRAYKRAECKICGEGFGCHEQLMLHLINKHSPELPDLNTDELVFKCDGCCR